MATSSGAPPASTPTTTGTTPEKKRLFILLGVGGVLALLVGGKFVLGALGGSSSAPEPTNSALVAGATDSAAPVTPSSSEGGSESPPANPDGVAVGATQVSAPGAGAGNPANLLPFTRYRRDPFQPFVLLPPPPTPLPPPPPTPPPPVPIPESAAVPTLGGNSGGGFGGFGGGFGGGSTPAGVPQPGRGNSIDQPFNLPRIVIPRLNARNTSPADAFPPPRSASGGGGGVTSPSFDKRLSGVVIGNGVRAVLEISGGPTPKSYVVQPGDVVEGITILSISRFNESGNQVTRMLIRENGGERYVDLKPGPPRTAPGEGAGGPGFGGP